MSAFPFLPVGEEALTGIWFACLSRGPMISTCDMPLSKTRSVTKVMLVLVPLSISLEPGTASAHTGSGEEHHHDEMIGERGRPNQISRVIDVEMDDTMRFTPSYIAIRQGETIRFAVRNGGKFRHEMVIGSLAALKAHAMHMMKFPGMKHWAPNQLSLEPGKTGEIFWHFTRAGNFHFGCLQAGHLEAGMIGSIEVK